MKKGFFKILFLAYSSFLGYTVNAQSDLLYISLAEDIYFEGDHINGAISFNSDQGENRSFLIQLVSAKGNIVESSYLEFEPNSAKNISLVLPNKLISGWYFLQVGTPGGFLLSNIVRVLILQNDQKSDHYYSLQDNNDFALFPEGGNKIIFGIPNTLFIKFYPDQEKKLPVKIELTNKLGQTILRTTVNSAGFARMIFTPETGQEYSIKATFADQSFSSQSIDKAFFSSKGVAMNITFIDNKSIKMRLSNNSTNVNGSTLKIVHRRKFLDEILIDSQSEHRLDISSYPHGLLYFILIDRDNNVLNKRLVFNRKSNVNKLNIPVQFKPNIPHRGELVEVTVNLNAEKVNFTDNTQVFIKVIDHHQTLNYGTSAGFNEMQDLTELKFLFPELSGLIASKTLAISELDFYFASNQSLYSSKFIMSGNMKSSEDYKIVLTGNLRSSDKQAIPYAPIVLTIPSIKGSLRYTKTNKMGQFSFTKLNFYGDQDIFLTPILSDTSAKYTLTLENILPNLDLEGCKSYYPKGHWESLINNKLLQKKLQKAYADTKSVLDSAINSNNVLTIESVLLPVDNVITLDDYVVVEDMAKFINPIVPYVQVSKNGDLRIFSTELRRKYMDPPLVLLDGVPYFDIPHLLKIDPIRFKKIEVISSLENIKRLGILGSSGVVSFYTSDGYYIKNDYPVNFTVSGYSKSIDDESEISSIDNENIPYLPSYVFFDVNKKPGVNGNISFNFIAPDVVTQLNFTLDLINIQGAANVSKIINIEK